MQSINITAINPLFMLVLLGTAIACIFLMIMLLLKWHQLSAAYLLVGGWLYLVGVIGVTIAFNVPLNYALAIVDPNSTEGKILLSLDFVQQQFRAGRVWGAVDCHESVVGYAIAREVDDTLYLQQIDVEPEHGRRGIGTALVTTVCAWAKQQGYSIVSLSTFGDLPWNAPFYSKLGFCHVDEAELTTGLQQIRLKEFEAGLPIFDRVIMHRKLKY